MKKKMIIGVIAMAGLFGACSADETDFAEEAEKFIKDQFEKEGVADAQVDCAEPANTDKNTTFDCTATAPDGQTYTVTATITDKNTVSIGAATPSGAGGEAPVEGDVEQEIEEGVDEVEEEIEEGVDEVEEEVEEEG